MPDALFDPRHIKFKPLDESDFPLLHKWLTTDFVTQWYKEEGSYEAINRKYLPRIRGEEKVSCFVIMYGNTPMGYIQTYLFDDFPEYNEFLQTDECGASLDLFIGEADYLHKGLGSVILKKFVTDFVFASNTVTTCLVDPDPKNTAAIRAYEKAGFTYLTTVHLPEKAEEHALMQLKR